MSGFGLFTRSVQDANVWLDDLGRVLGSDDERAIYAALRAVLHALRDGLPVDEAAKLARHMPVLMRGIYFDGWDPARQPLDIRDRIDLIQLVRAHLQPFPLIEAEDAATAVVQLLFRHLDPDDMAEVMAALPDGVGELALRHGPLAPA
ncbi:MAG TPA: DUF2267 domain-containing protein [Azospirillaceae bacterium]|nr:DUF2267 domain-containing protein [Azospirillaceae bacterium]